MIKILQGVSEVATDSMVLEAGKNPDPKLPGLVEDEL
jgi:hypothetical protein